MQHGKSNSRKGRLNRANRPAPTLSKNRIPKNTQSNSACATKFSGGIAFVVSYAVVAQPMSLGWSYMSITLFPSRTVE